MIKNATLNEEGKVEYYICSQCGNKYKARFGITTLCFTCTEPIQRHIQERLGTNIKFK